MAEETHTGGLRKFVIPKGYQPERDVELEKKIEEGYEKYYKRKKRNRIIKIIILLIILFIVGLLILR